MDVTRARVALRERPLLDVLDLAVRFCVEHAGPYAWLAVAVLAPGLGVSWVAAAAFGWWAGWATAVAGAALAAAPFIVLSSRLVFAERVQTGAVLRESARALPGLLGLRLLELLAAALSLLLAGLPWLWLGTLLLFDAEVLVLERAGVGAAMSRAARLSSSHLGSVASAMFLLLLAPPCAAMLADAAGRELMQGMLEVRPPPSMFQAGGSWLAFAGFWASVPLLTTARFLVYLDVRTRSEGWDIQTRFAALAARPGQLESPRRAA